jgi:hypothetical protein
VNGNQQLSNYAGQIISDLTLIQDILTAVGTDDETRRKIGDALATAGDATQAILGVLRAKLEETAV